VEDAESMQMIATRENTPNATAIPFWNHTDKKFDTDSNLTWTANALNVNNSLTTNDNTVTFNLLRSNISDDIARKIYLGGSTLGTNSSEEISIGSTGSSVVIPGNLTIAAENLVLDGQLTFGSSLITSEYTDVTYSPLEIIDTTSGTLFEVDYEGKTRIAGVTTINSLDNGV
jgi:hypothetical protein